MVQQKGARFLTSILLELLVSLPLVSTCGEAMSAPVNSQSDVNRHHKINL